MTLVLEKRRGVITTIKTFATHDGPGIRTTVFLKGCPLRCVWCSSPETWVKETDIYFRPQKCMECGKCVEACAEKAMTMVKERKIIREKCSRCLKCVDKCVYRALERVGETVSAMDVFRRIEEDEAFYLESGGGATLSGGEPLYQPDFAEAIAALCKEKSIHVTLDTSGYGETGIVKRILRNVDLVLLDIKHMDSSVHRKLTGVSNELILRNGEVMAENCEVIISIPLISGLTDSQENIEKTVRYADSINVSHIDLIPLHKLGAHKYMLLGMKSPFEKLQPPPEARIREIVEFLLSLGIKVSLNRLF